jgi:hypothetical protein
LVRALLAEINRPQKGRKLPPEKGEQEQHAKERRINAAKETQQITYCLLRARNR